MYKVLIVDDEHMIKESLSTMIENVPLDFQVVGLADEGKLAFTLAKKLEPNLVITDIRMPVMDGLELIERLRNELSLTEIIVISGYGEFEYAQKAIRADAIDYLLKPIKIDLFQKALEKVHKKLSTNQNTSEQNTDDSLNILVEKLSPKTKIAVEFIHKNYNDADFSLQKVAQHIELSSAYFSRIFKEETNSSFIHYLTSLRMEKAKEILNDPYSKSYEAAYKVGYIDYPHFSKAFKKQFGVSPSEFRKKLHE